MVSFRSCLAVLIGGGLLCAVPLPSAENAGHVPAVITKWLSGQTNIQTWTADVLQIRTLKTLTQPLMATGHVWFAAPNQFRWEIGQPAQTIAVRKSEEMLVIYPRLKRVERYSFTDQANGPWKDTLALLEAGFPRNETDLTRQFKIYRISTSNEICQLILEPKSLSARHMMPQLNISFSTNDSMLRSTQLQFADGSTLRNEFSHPSLNPPIDRTLFAPELPTDYKSVEPMKH